MCICCDQLSHADNTLGVPAQKVFESLGDTSDHSVRFSRFFEVTSVSSYASGRETALHVSHPRSEISSERPRSCNLVADDLYSPLETCFSYIFVTVPLFPLSPLFSELNDPSTSGSRNIPGR